MGRKITSRGILSSLIKMSLTLLQNSSQRNEAKHASCNNEMRSPRILQRLMKDVGQDLWLAQSVMTQGDTRYGIPARKTIAKTKKLIGFVSEPDPRIAI